MNIDGWIYKPIWLNDTVDVDINIGYDTCKEILLAFKSGSEVISLNYGYKYYCKGCIEGFIECSYDSLWDYHISICTVDGTVEFSLVFCENYLIIDVSHFEICLGRILFEIVDRGDIHSNWVSVLVGDSSGSSHFIISNTWTPLLILTSPFYTATFCFNVYINWTPMVEFDQIVWFSYYLDLGVEIV